MFYTLMDTKNDVIKCSKLKWNNEPQTELRYHDDDVSSWSILSSTISKSQSARENTHSYCKKPFLWQPIRARVCSYPGTIYSNHREFLSRDYWLIVASEILKQIFAREERLQGLCSSFKKQQISQENCQSDIPGTEALYSSLDFLPNKNHRAGLWNFKYSSLI